MEGHCSTGQSPQWAVVPMEEEEEEIYIVTLCIVYLSSSEKVVRLPTLLKIAISCGHLYRSTVHSVVYLITHTNTCTAHDAQP